MAVPYTFGSATTSIPLSQLDSNFATAITLGNTAVQLGNTITNLTGVTNLASSGALTLGSNGNTTAVTIDTSQNVGIGTSSPSYNLHVKNGGGNCLIAAQYGTGTIGLLTAGSNTVDLKAFNGTNDVLTFTTGASERMRIDSSGNLLVGKTTTADTTAGWSLGAGSGNVGLSSGNYFIFDQISGGSGYTFVDFRSAGTSKGSISYNGTLTLYNQTSDKRLKENIVDSGTALETIGQIKIRAFDWIDSKRHETHGVVAQELKDVAPQCVTEGTNHEDGSMDRPWQVDTSPLVPMLIKAIQELKALVDTQASTITQLQADVAALKGTA